MYRDLFAPFAILRESSLLKRIVHPKKIQFFNSIPYIVCVCKALEPILKQTAGTYCVGNEVMISFPDHSK